MAACGGAGSSGGAHGEPPAQQWWHVGELGSPAGHSEQLDQMTGEASSGGGAHTERMG